MFQDLRAILASEDEESRVYFWRTLNKLEVDFVVYGPKYFAAIEAKASHRLQAEDFASLRAFGEDYPQAKRVLIYAGTRSYYHEGIHVVPATEWFKLSIERRLA